MNSPHLDRLSAKEFQEIYGSNETIPQSKIQNPKPKRDKAAALGATVRGEKESLQRTLVRFTGWRVRPLDPDNFAGGTKDLLDGLRHAKIIPGDEPWRIILETEQFKVDHYSQEETIIEVIIP